MVALLLLLLLLLVISFNDNLKIYDIVINISTMPSSIYGITAKYKNLSTPHSLLYTAMTYAGVLYTRSISVNYFTVLIFLLK